MSQTGELFGESPQACPFVALELDRDRRSDKPDYRHRCFAEPTPQPRAIAHQEAYCLSSEFVACPIFQGWAMRAAARPVPAPSGREGRPAPPQTPLSTVDEAQAAAAQAALPVDVPPVVPAPGEAWPAETFRPAMSVDAPAQLAAFEPADSGDWAGVDELQPAGLAEAAPSEAAPSEAAPTDVPPAGVPPLEQEFPGADEEAPVPDFLAGRAERTPAPRPRASQPDVRLRETVSREDLVPSWDLTGRYGADPGDGHGGRRGRDDDDGGGGGGFGGLATAIVVVAILALGVAGVIFLPGLIAGRPAATTTPAITLAPTFLSSPTLPVASGTPIATLAPTATPDPGATPRLYTIKSGDTLRRIAQRFDVTVADILAANPQITDPNHIVPGQVITIPPRPEP
jgi:nucleoid-associated protein YgaU